MVQTAMSSASGPSPSSVAFLRQPVVWCSLVVIGIVVVLSLLSKWTETSQQYSKPFVRKLKYLIEQATRWNGMAQQDTNPILQLMHCSYALVYAQVARSVVSEKDIADLTGIDIQELIYYLGECESYATKNIGQQCPKIKIDGVYSLGSGWN
jgi:hypothetical protein